MHKVSVVVRLDGNSREVKVPHSSLFDQWGNQAQAWSKDLARRLAQLSNHRVFGNSPVCVSRNCTVSESCPETWSGKEGAVGQHGSACQVC